MVAAVSLGQSLRRSGCEFTILLVVFIITHPQGRCQAKNEAGSFLFLVAEFADDDLLGLVDRAELDADDLVICFY